MITSSYTGIVSVLYVVGTHSSVVIVSVDGTSTCLVILLCSKIQSWILGPIYFTANPFAKPLITVVLNVFTSLLAIACCLSSTASVCSEAIGPLFTKEFKLSLAFCKLFLLEVIAFSTSILFEAPGFLLKESSSLLICVSNSLIWVFNAFINTAFLSWEIIFCLISAAPALKTASFPSLALNKALNLASIAFLNGCLTGFTLAGLGDDALNLSVSSSSLCLAISAK